MYMKHEERIWNGSISLAEEPKLVRLLYSFDSTGKCTFSTLWALTLHPIPRRAGSVARQGSQPTGSQETFSSQIHLTARFTFTALKEIELGYIILMLTNYFHDLAVALLAANVILIHMVDGYLKDEPDRKAVLARLVGKLSRVTWFALSYVVAAGAVRAYFFMEFEWNPLVEKEGMLVALGVKHVLLVGLTVFGIIGQLRHKRRYIDHT